MTYGHVALLDSATGTAFLDAANHDVTDVASLAGTPIFTEHINTPLAPVLSAFEISLRRPSFGPRTKYQADYFAFLDDLHGRKLTCGILRGSP